MRKSILLFLLGLISLFLGFALIFNVITISIGILSHHVIGLLLIVVGLFCIIIADSSSIV